MSLISDLEKKFNKPVISSNQALIWDSLKQVGSEYNVEEYGELFKN